VDVSLNGAERIIFSKPLLRNEITTVHTSGTHTIAGPDTSYGPIELGIVSAKRPSDAEYATTTEVETFRVGSQEEPSYPLHLSGVRGNSILNLEEQPDQPVTKSFTNTVRVPPFDLTVPRPLIGYYEGRDRLNDYGAYVSDSHDDEYLQIIVDYYKQHSRGSSDRRIINNMIGFVQNLEYTDDQVSSGFNDYAKFPVETLAEKGGDCEDTCILLSSLLDRFGYGTVLLAHWDENHMSLGVAGEDSIPGAYYEHNGTNYYYVETTAAGWSIGQVPPDLEGASAEIIPVQNNPDLVFSYVVGVATGGGSTIEAAVRNVGNAPTTTAQFRAEFQDRRKNTTATATSDQLTLTPEGEKTVNLSARPPDDTAQRVKASVLLGGEVHDTLVSDYQEPIETPK